MDNEEKILQMLEKHGAMLGQLVKKIDKLEGTVSEIDRRSERT